MTRKKMGHMTLEWLGASWGLLALVGIGAGIALNSTFIYQLIVDYYELTYPTGLSREALMINYREIMWYLQLPWIRELHMSDFEMSVTGRIHFEEVKVIFQVLYAALISFVIAGIAARKRINTLRVLNKATHLIILLFGLFGLLMVFNFDTAFLWFHKVLFNNDYWIFNATTDPVILALPKELFFIMGIFVLLLLFIGVIIIKVWYYRSRKKDGLSLK